MSRWVLALVSIGFAVASVRADPKPLWEIDMVAGAKKTSAVLWIDFAPDGKTLLAHCEERDADGVRERFVARDVKTHEERQLAAMGTRGPLNMGWRSNAITKTGTVLIPEGRAQMVRLKDGKGAALRPVETGAVAVWPGPGDAEAVWLLVRRDDALSPELAVAFGTVPNADPKKADPNERWAEAVLPLKESHRLTALTINPDAALIAVATTSDDTHLLTLHTFTGGAKLKLTERAAVPGAHKGAISRMAFSPDGKTLATGSQDSTVFLWDVEKVGKDWKPRATLPAGNFTVATLAFSPDGRTLAAGTLDNKGRPNLYLIDASAGKLLASHRLESSVMSVAYSPDGKVLATGDYLGRIKAWDPEALRNP